MSSFLLSLSSVVFSAGQTDGLAPDAVAQLLAGDQATSQSAGEIPRDCLDIPPDELLAEVDAYIAERDVENALQGLDQLVRCFNEYLEEAEIRFRQIRTINEEYVAKGEEVQAKLQELLSEDIAPEDLLPTAVEALGLIAEMVEIIPNPNARDALIVEDLRYTVQLNIDRRRFTAMMTAAAERLADEDYAGAAEIYISGIDDAAELSGTGDDQSIESLLVTLENGIDIQRRFFEDRDYGLLGDQIVSTRESIRSIGSQFVTVGPEALQGAADLSAAFSEGQFTDAESRIDEYLSVLAIVTDFVREIDQAGAALTEAEAFVSDQTVANESARYDWHIRFLRDIVLGREDASRSEGLAVVVDSVRQIVEAGPVEAARSYGESRLSVATTLLDAIEWPAVATEFPGLAGIEADVVRADEMLSQASASFRTHAAILAVARMLDLGTVLPPETVGDVDQSALQLEWLDYADSVLDSLSGLTVVEDESIRSQIIGSYILTGSASLLRGVGVRAHEALEGLISRRTTMTSLNSQRGGLQLVLGSLTDPAPGTLREMSERLSGFALAASEQAAVDQTAADSLEYMTEAVGARIDDMERYELGIAEAVARLEYNGLNMRLLSLQSRTSAAQRQLDGIAETVTSVDESGRVVRDDTGRIVSFQTVRKYPDRTRDTLVPMVGPVSGTRILSTANGEFQTLLNDAGAFIARYQNELPHIAGEQSILDEIARGQELVTVVGSVTDPALFRRGRDLLQEALLQIATAQELEASGEDTVETIRDLILEAHAANDAEDLDTAGVILQQAARLLKSEEFGFNDASDLYSESLAVWYRPQVEDRWNVTQSELNDQIALAQAEIVLIRVQQAVDEAQPMVDNQLWADALGVLQVADELWAGVFPQYVYPPLVRLLRFVETALAKQNERTLREDDPDYDKLAPLLSRATQAVTEELFSEAESLLDQFLRAQPNNLEARLLEVDIALQGGEGDLASKINRLIENSLPEGASRGELEQLDPADALELQSLLIALRTRLSDRSDATGFILAQISADIETLELILSPPRTIVTTPDLRAEADALVSRALSNGDLETLSRNELGTALGLLEDALTLVPTHVRALELLSLALRLPNAPRREALDATEQQVFKEARDTFSRGDATGALVLVEQLWADPANRNDTELNRFREELQDAIRRGQ